MSRRQTPSVAIFGAGIAGLTAAHELVERGFEVWVIEQEPATALDDLEGKLASVGGMARTQWARVPKRPLAAGTPDAGMCEATPLCPRRIDRISIDPCGRLGEKQKAVVKAAAEMLKDVDTVHVVGYCAERGLPRVVGPTGSDLARIDVQLADVVRRELVQAGLHEDRLTVVGNGLGHPGDLNRRDADRCYVELVAIEDWMPGEHGFRFFPSFYRNLFHTMRRIPISEPGATFTETGRTVFDNLLPTQTQGFAFTGGRWVTVPRRPMSSIREALDVATDLLGAFGCPQEEAARLPLKLLQYLTSCRGRREDLEDVSWWDFIDGDGFSEPFRRFLDDGPQLLVAMRGRASDARTIGTIAVQLLLDHLKVADRVDATLNGPTSLAWFAHWRRYLEHQRVVFMNDTLIRIVPSPDNVTAVVETGGSRNAISCDYVLVAVSPQGAREVVEASTLQDPDSERIRRLGLGTGADRTPAESVGHMAGIQFYFATDISLFHGHVIYPDSPWALSSISQPQFWVQKRGEWSGYRGILSVDVGNWTAKSPTEAGLAERSAWDCSPEEIAAEVWRQIKACLPDPSAVPEPLYFHIDQNLHFKKPSEGKGIECNTLPYVINPPGTYRDRPGEFDHGRTGPRRYRLRQGDRLVYAGSWVRTHTRLNTMEAANESARLAVNGILEAEARRSGRPFEPCLVFDPEEHEWQDVRYLVELDERLHAEGLPHMLDILDVGGLPDAVLGEFLARRPR